MMYCTCLYFNVALPVLLLFTGCNGQTQQTQQQSFNTTQNAPRVGGACETCELINVGIPSTINATDTSAGWQLSGQKLVVSGTVYQPEKKTPAPGVILYYWQTDNKGKYATNAGLAPEARRHGYIRGWVKSDPEGRYTIFTNRPVSYPSSNNPAHIHMLVKEPDLANEYYIDGILFEDDPLLTDDVKNNLQEKAGSGVVKVSTQKGVQKATRDIILGLNITDYPKGNK